jgi:hypothetical protein
MSTAKKITQRELVYQEARTTSLIFRLTLGSAYLMRSLKHSRKSRIEPMLIKELRKSIFFLFRFFYFGLELDLWRNKFSIFGRF